MVEGCAGFLNVFKTFVVDGSIEYVGGIRRYEENLGSLHRNLSDLCSMLDDVNKKVKEGRERGEQITGEVARWFQAVRKLYNDEHLKEVMYQDMRVANFVVNMMTKNDLKSHLNGEIEMQRVVVKVIKMLKLKMENSGEEYSNVVQRHYYKIVEVVVEMMKDTVEKFKKMLKEDMKLAIIATNTLNDNELDILTIDDMEMEEIIGEALDTSDKELWLEHKDEKSDVPVAILEKNLVKEAAGKVLSPIEILLTLFGKLMDDPDLKNVMPKAETVKLGLDVIDGLWVKSSRSKKEMDRNTGCCCYHPSRYKISKAAEKVVALMKDSIISQHPREPVTRLFNVLESRSKLAYQILQKLKDDKVDTVGLFGMAGIGKTMLAKQVSKNAKDIFDVIVMVEVSKAPNILHIQRDIAESMNLYMNSLYNIDQRAIRLYNRLNSDRKENLIILDNVWGKLDLNEIGIPKNCKLLLTTRDRDVCRVMGIQKADILEMGLINANEARDLFMSQIGNQVNGEECEEVVARLLGKCGGLPLPIVDTATSLKEKDLCSSETFTLNYHATYSSLDMSYKAMEVVEKRMFFLLACLFPGGSTISIETLTRYGIGFYLFPRVNKLSEAMQVADNWIGELVLSSMLLEGNVKGDFKIHDMVRDFAISCAAKAESHNFMVKDIPCWLEDESFNEYTAMSLMSNYDCLSGVEAAKLQILVLRGDSSTHFDDFFFEGMLNLKVLDLSNMNFYPRLPDSIWKLKKLRTLCLERCKLGDVKQIAEFVNLLVLSLTESFVEELPGEIGKLHKLRLLDLSGCVSSKEPLIPADILDKLSRLEGLYILNTTQALTATKSGAEGTSATWYHKFPRLNALEIQVAHFDELPIDGQAAQHLDRFKVYIGGDWRTIDETLTQFRRVMSLNGIDLFSGMLGKSCLVLLKKADWLKIHRCTNFENLIPQLDKGFRDLTSLNIHSCNDVKCIAKGSGLNDLLAFPHLRELDLYDLKSLKMVCDGDVPQGTFSNLQILHLRCLWALEYVLPLALLPPNLTRVDVVDCESLNFMFIQNEETEVVELSFLKSLTISGSPSLASLVSPENIHNTSAALQVTPIFFDAKMVFPSLEIFKLVDCPNVIKLWSKDLDAQGFQNLKEIMIRGCDKLLSIGSPGVFSTLVRLETLCIMGCRAIREVVTLEDTERGEHIIRFPKLKYLELDDLESIETFYGGRSDLEFPQLQRLKLNNLKRMSRFANAENSSALFHGKIKFPRLEELHVSNVNDEVTGLWDSKSCGVERGSVVSNPAPMLKELNVRGTEGLQPMLLRLFIRWAVPLSDMKLKDMGKDSEPDTSIRRAEQVGSYDKLHFYQRSM